MYRHFILNHDYALAIASARDETIDVAPYHQIRLDRISSRLQNTRFCRSIINATYFRNWHALPGGLLRFAREFNPDLIFSVVDDWHMGLAWQLSRRLRRPLAVNFQDLFALSGFQSVNDRPYPRTTRFLVNKYQFLNDHAEVVFHTSSGMRNWFPKPRGDVLYPIGHARSGTAIPAPWNFEGSRPLQLVYAGNCYGAYGRMILRLAEASLLEPRLSLRIFASGNDWAVEDVRRFEAAGVYHGFKPFRELQTELRAADAFLTVMSFEPDQRTFMETSFTTKWLDYAPLGKPIFVWGPAYSTAHHFSRNHEAGETIDAEDPRLVVKTILSQADHPACWRRLAEGAARAANGPLNSGQIHELLKSRINSAIDSPSACG